MTAPERYERSERALKAAGGKRTQVRLGPESVKKIKLIMRQQGFETQREAIEWALALAP